MIPCLTFCTVQVTAVAYKLEMKLTLFCNALPVTCDQEPWKELAAYKGKQSFS